MLRFGSGVAVSCCNAIAQASSGGASPPTIEGSRGWETSLQGPKACYLYVSPTEGLQGPSRCLSGRVHQNMGEGEGEG